MHLAVVVLGSGTSVPAPRRRPPALLVKCNGVPLLFDCGAGSSTALVEAGVTLGDLAGVFITHFHLDHTAELAPMLFALRNPASPRRRDALIVWGPVGMKAQLSALRRAHGRWVEPRCVDVRAVELAPRRPVRVGPVQVRPFSVDHAEPSFAYRIEAHDKVVCYSGDTGPCDELLAAARDADLFVCECAALEREGVRGHLSATDVGRIAAAARCRKVLLTHIYPRIAESDPVSRVRRYFAGEVLLGADGMRFTAELPGC